MSSWYSAPTAINAVDKLSEQKYTQSVHLFLDDEDLFKQLMKCSQTQTNFLITHPELIYQLLDYVVILPNLTDSDDRKYKYPMLSCDLLIKNEKLIQQLVKQQVTRKDCLNRLFKFFDKKSNIYSILPGYFQRVFYIISKHQTYCYLLQYLKQNSEIISKMISFTESISISKCLLVLIGVDSKQDYNICDIRAWMEFKKQTLKQCLLELKNTNDQFMTENLLDLIKELVEKQQFIYHKRDLLPILFQKQNIETYFIIANSSNLKYQALLFINTNLAYLLKIITEEKQRILTQGQNTQNNIRAQLITPSLGRSHLEECIKNLTKILQNAEWRSSLQSIQLIQAIILSLKTQESSPCRMIINLSYNVFEKIWRLVSSLPNNNIIQNKFFKLIEIVVSHLSEQLISKAFSSTDNFNMIQSVINFTSKKPDSYDILVKVIKLWFSSGNTTLMQSYFKANEKIVNEFSNNQTLHKYLKTTSIKCGFQQIQQIRQIDDQKENKYTVKKFIIQKKQEELNMQKPSMFGCIDINFSNCPPSIAPDAPENFQTVVIPFTFDNDLKQLSLQKNCSITSQESIQQKESQKQPVKIVKQASFSQFMKSRIQSVTAELQQKSKTPSKKNQRQSSRSASKKKVNRWGGNIQNVPPSQSNICNQSPKSSKSCLQKSVSESVTATPSSVVYLPKINLYKIPSHKIKMSKTLPTKQRKISPRRDQKLHKIMKILREQVPIKV